MQAKQSLRSAHPRQPAYTHTDPFQRGNGWRQCRQMWACRGPSLANLCPQWASMGIRGLAWAPPKPASCLRWRWWADVGPPQPTPCQYRPCVGNSGAHQSPPAPALGQCRGGILCYLGCNGALLISDFSASGPRWAFYWPGVTSSRRGRKIGGRWSAWSRSQV